LCCVVRTGGRGEFGGNSTTNPSFDFDGRKLGQGKPRKEEKRREEKSEAERCFHSTFIMNPWNTSKPSFKAMMKREV
jgi:hypothetical protein